ncbi:hypothetical protein K402DRAFT_394569 [Aulographum hederae CBS 113979]|uniref:Uncharacterized protein n=1 Tax=Aulographum hederae CBS 113979 TaxID=1176131 RepID=A0A6G1GXY0_9PEZI|nr:hypothetical protein K402DRAFT_394569 [Aulographum hederae CBS 113979]
MTNYSRPSLRREGTGESANSTSSAGSGASHPSRELLFGEIPSSPSIASGPTSFHSNSNSSVCHLVLSTSPAFIRFWSSDESRSAFLSQVGPEDIPHFRLVCHDFASRAAPFCFKDVDITFKTTTFGKPARMAALERIGHHVKSLTFNIPHTQETFLPPLIDPCTGEERRFVYQPQVHTPTTLAGKVRQPKYGSWEMTELLISQYPPLFHSATNVSAFVRGFSSLPNISHLKISCPDQESSHRFRRSIVDYVLVSLRIALERAQLPYLSSLSLSPIHPSALFYLNPLLGFGATPSSSRRWAQIHRLDIEMESFAFDRSTRHEHLRILRNYLRHFSPHITCFSFRWRGEKGPSPFSTSPEMETQSSSRPTSRERCDSLQGSPTRKSVLRSRLSQSPLPPPKRKAKPLFFPYLSSLNLSNAVMDACEISSFIQTHRRSLTDFNFEDVLLRTGDWDEALEPLTTISGGDAWKRKMEGEVMDVPLMFSDVESESSNSVETPTATEADRVAKEIEDLLLPSLPRPMERISFDAPPEQLRNLRDEEEKVLFGRLFSSSKGRRVKRKKEKKDKEHLWGCEEGMRRFLRGAVLAWR